MGENVGMESQSQFLELSDEDPDTIYELFEKHGWGDGLPLVAPTDKRVTEMLSHIGASPEEVLTVLLLLLLSLILLIPQTDLLCRGSGGFGRGQVEWGSDPSRP